MTLFINDNLNVIKLHICSYFCNSTIMTDIQTGPNVISFTILRCLVSMQMVINCIIPAAETNIYVTDHMSIWTVRMYRYTRMVKPYAYGRTV